VGEGFPIQIVGFVLCEKEKGLGGWGWVGGWRSPSVKRMDVLRQKCYS
jgi:hypothetical protein